MREQSSPDAPSRGEPRTRGTGPIGHRAPHPGHRAQRGHRPERAPSPAPGAPSPARAPSPPARPGRLHPAAQRCTPDTGGRSCPLFNEHLTAGTFCTDPRRVYCQNSPAGEVEGGGGVACRPLSQPRIAAHGKQRTLFPRRGVPQGQRGAMPGAPRAAARPPARRCPAEGAASAEVFPRRRPCRPRPRGAPRPPAPAAPTCGEEAQQQQHGVRQLRGEDRALHAGAAAARSARRGDARAPAGASGVEPAPPRARAAPPPHRRGDGRR